MKNRIPVTRLLEIGLALVYGAILGSRLPLPGPDAIFAMPAVTASLAASVHVSAPEDPMFADEIRPAAEARAPRDTGTRSQAESLPGAPLRAVLQVAAPTANAAGSTAVRSGANGGDCIGAEGADDAACRAAVRARLRSLCPRPGDLTHRGPVVCLREED